MVFLSIAVLFRQNPPRLTSQGLEGYISMEVPAPPEGFGYGVSLYATAWPLLAKPLRDFQIGLASIWIVPDNRKIDYPLLPHGTLARDNWPERGPSYRDVFQTIEGGLGFWGDTRYGSPTTKFRMNGTANGYNHMIASPGWGFGNFENTKSLAPDQMGIAQMSNRILVPPDGFTFKAGTNGELFGYAWMALPLTQAKAMTAGKPVPTGNQSWTLFLNTKNFKGPVAFYTPWTWSRVSRDYAPAAGRGLDSLPGLVTGGAIEVNTVPEFEAALGNATYTRIPQLQFPVDTKDETILIHDLTHYSKAALFNEVETWLEGGNPAPGRFERTGSSTPKVKANPLRLNQGPKHTEIKKTDAWVETCEIDPSTFGLKWNPDKLQSWEPGIRQGVFPDYFKATGNTLEAVDSSQVPVSTGLTQAEFHAAESDKVYVSGNDPTDVWHKPGPASGPFQTTLSDGSLVTYYWYRFIDQPALQDADLTPTERDRLQAVVEKLQAVWTPNKEYMPANRLGKLTELDPGLLMKPPKGLERGYVPIAVRQESQKGRK